MVAPSVVNFSVHILLIDDDAELCLLLGEFLQREGFTVDCEHEGYRGLEKARGVGVDLVVLDVMLPGIDGFEILRRLRQESKVPVMMLTARGEDVDRIVGLDLGADDYLRGSGWSAGVSCSGEMGYGYCGGCRRSLSCVERSICREGFNDPGENLPRGASQFVFPESHHTPTRPT
jgi:CheY-like chemotaxis protein